MCRKKLKTFFAATALTLNGIFLVALNNEVKKYKSLSSKNLNNFYLMHRWLQVCREGKSVVNYLEVKGCKRVAIYGMGLAGERLLDELRNTDIRVLYGIDKRAHTLNGEIEIYSLYDKLPNVDIVIVSVPMYFDSIKLELEKKTNCKIVSLDDILHEI